MVKTLLYAGESTERSEALVAAVAGARPHGPLEVHRRLEQFAEALREPRGDMIILVILAGSRDELLGILDLGPIMGGHQLILILPDQEEETILTGHLLVPRFQTFMDGNFNDVLQVLGKMTAARERSDRPHPPGSAMSKLFASAESEFRPGDAHGRE